MCPPSERATAKGRRRTNPSEVAARSISVAGGYRTNPSVDLVAKLLGNFLGDTIIRHFLECHFAVGELTGHL